MATRKYFSENQTAEYLGISKKTLQRHRAMGSGPVFAKCGGRILYDVTDCDAWVSAQKFASTSQYGGQ